MSVSRDPMSRRSLRIHASYISAVHTYLAFSAFASALFVGCSLHYKKIVKNGVAGYPEEFFPSVSATIGDWYPERNIFQILIALTSGPRFALVFLQYYLARSSTSALPKFVFVSGLIRTLSCGGWVYITSYDDHDMHDIFMITYMVTNLPWMIGGISLTARDSKARRKRTIVATMFFASIVPLIYYFIQHKVYRVPGAYTRYSFFEWGLIVFDILYDSVAAIDFKEANLQISLGVSVPIHARDEIARKDRISERKQGKSETAISPRLSQSPNKVTSNVHWQTFWLDGLLACRPLLSFASDVYLSYIFWSISTSLIPTLFYFSIWKLGIAGHELALLTMLSSILLNISPLLTWSKTRSGRSALHLLSFSGLTAYVLDKPLHRLFVVTFSCVPLIIGQTVNWSTYDASESGYQGVLLGLGLVLSSLSKHANHSNNPVWPFVNENSGGCNKTGITLAFLGLYEFLSRPPPAGKSYVKPQLAPSSSGLLYSAVPLGSLLFGLYTLLADSSTLITWSWTGYENTQPRGPLPHLHGALTLIAQALGLLIPILFSSYTHSNSLLTHPVWFCYGAASAAVMYYFKNWTGYVGGLNAAVFYMSVTPFVLHRAAANGAVAKTFFTAWLVWCLLTLASVWTVAYAFVPGGVYLRERIDLVLAVHMGCLALAFRWPRMNQGLLSVQLPAATRSYSRSFLALVSVLSVFVTFYRWQSPVPLPLHPGPRIVNAAIWTVHFGFDNQGRDSQRRIRNVLRDLQLDVVGLLETDLHRVVFGNRDLTRVVAEDLGYYVDIGPGPNSHTWGAVLLSKFPIINSTHHLLPSPHGELAPAIEAVLDMYGTPVTVIVSHNGQEEDPLDRELQSKELARIMAASYPKPVIFLGYVVTKPLAPRPAPYDILVKDGRMHDIDSSDMDRWCEYILYRGLYRTSYARVSRGMVTDTELQIGQFVLPRHGYGVTNETDEARYLRSWKEDLPEDHWFPLDYYGNDQEGGVDGHYYHVFGTPLYYRIPDGAVL